MDAPQALQLRLRGDPGPGRGVAAEDERLPHPGLRHDSRQRLGVPFAVQLDWGRADGLDREARRDGRDGVRERDGRRGRRAGRRLRRGARRARARASPARRSATRAPGVATAGASGVRSAWAKSHSCSPCDARVMGGRLPRTMDSDPHGCRRAPRAPDRRTSGARRAPRRGAPHARAAGAAAGSRARRRAPCCRRWRTAPSPRRAVHLRQSCATALGSNTPASRERCVADDLVDPVRRSARRRRRARRARGTAASCAARIAGGTSPSPARFSTCFSSSTRSL